MYTCSGHFLTLPWLWHMSSQSLTDVLRMAPSRAFNPASSPIPDFERVRWLMEESDPITENSILESNLNSTKVVPPGGSSSLSTAEDES